MLTANVLPAFVGKRNGNIKKERKKMKKLLALVLTLVMIVGVLASCTTPDPDPEPTPDPVEEPKVGEIKLEVNGGTVTGFDGKYTVGDYVFLPTPVAPDYKTFTGWYSDEALTTKVDNIIKTSVEGDVKLYAGYVLDLLKPDGSSLNDAILSSGMAKPGMMFGKRTYVDNLDGTYTYTCYAGFDTDTIVLPHPNNGSDGNTGMLYIDRTEASVLKDWLDANPDARYFEITIEIGLDKDATKVLPFSLNGDGRTTFLVTGVPEEDGKIYAYLGGTKIAELKKGELTTVTFYAEYGTPAANGKYPVTYTAPGLEEGTEATVSVTAKRPDMERVERVNLGMQVWKTDATAMTAIELAEGETASIIIGAMHYNAVAKPAAAE